MALNEKEMFAVRDLIARYEASGKMTTPRDMSKGAVSKEPRPQIRKLGGGELGQKMGPTGHLI